MDEKAQETQIAPVVLDKRELLTAGGITLTPVTTPARFKPSPALAISLGDRPWYGKLCVAHFKQD